MITAVVGDVVSIIPRAIYDDASPASNVLYTWSISSASNESLSSAITLALDGAVALVTCGYIGEVNLLCTAKDLTFGTECPHTEQLRILAPRHLASIHTQHHIHKPMAVPAKPAAQTMVVTGLSTFSPGVVGQGNTASHNQNVAP